MMIQCTRQLDGRGGWVVSGGVWEGAEEIRYCRQVQVELVRVVKIFQLRVNRRVTTRTYKIYRNQPQMQPRQR